MATFDACSFCGGELHASSAENGWRFVCTTCDRVTEYSDGFMALLMALSE